MCDTLSAQGRSDAELQSSELTVYSNEEYARPDGIPLQFDLYHPGGESVPLVVFLHGGGWISGDRTMFTEEAEWFCSQGFAAATIDYRLAPLYPFPAAVLDVQEFLRFIRSSSLGTDPRRIAAFGNSAGGHLAAMLGVGYAGGPTVDAVVDVCGITDVRNPDSSQFPISMSFVEQFLGGPYPGREGLYAEASPVALVRGKCCPFIIIHGAQDDVVPVAQSRSLYDALRSYGGEARLIELEGEGHSFSLDAWDLVREESVAFLKGAFDES